MLGTSVYRSVGAVPLVVPDCALFRMLAAPLSLEFERTQPPANAILARACCRSTHAAYCNFMLACALSASRAERGSCAGFFELVPMSKRRREQPDIPSTEVHECVRAAYRTLGKHGKPDESQHTVLAAIVLTRPSSAPQLVSLATGTKCLPAHARSERGEVLHDLHAEVLARRCALHWLYAELEAAVTAPAQDPGEPEQSDMQSPLYALRGYI